MLSTADHGYTLAHPNRIAEDADFGFAPRELSSTEVLQFLDDRIQDVLTEFRQSELWCVISDAATNSKLIQEIMKQVYLEIVMYQPDVIEATISVIAQMPRTLGADLFEQMIHHQVEEFTHGEMALRDYIGLGGDEDAARIRRMSPTAFSTAAMWRMLAHMRDPFAYLGAIYPFEGLTPIVTDMVKGILREKGFQDNSIEFVEYHSTADLEHTRMIKELILTVTEDFPDSKSSICYGIEYFLAVYPLPGWNAAFRRAKRNLAVD